MSPLEVAIDNVAQDFAVAIGVLHRLLSDRGADLEVTIDGKTIFISWQSTPCEILEAISSLRGAT